MIPGLLQTPQYARAILETHPDVTEDVVNERLAGRLFRQAVLDREDPPPPVVCALIDQSALMREIGGPTVMRDQLAHLVAVSRRPNITVQIIPNTGAHPGLLGAFTAVLIGAGRVRVKSSARAGGCWLGLPRLWCGVADPCGLPRLWCGVRGPCGPAAGLDGGGLSVTPTGLWDLSPFYSLAPGPDPEGRFLLP